MFEFMLILCKYKLFIAHFYFIFILWQHKQRIMVCPTRTLSQGIQLAGFVKPERCWVTTIVSKSTVCNWNCFFLTENFLVQEGKIGLTLLFIINIWHFCYCFSETRKLNLHWLDQIQLQESFVGHFSAGETFIQSNNIVRILSNRNNRNR